jgi:hypothetical protein
MINHDTEKNFFRRYGFERGFSHTGQRGMSPAMP